jgi:CRP/FNR family cyclic AMP-dependent transcriptional regulator
MPLVDAPDLSKIAGILASVPLFATLSKAQVRRLAETAKDRRFTAGDAMVKQGDKGIGFYLILEGTASVEKGGRPVASLGPGQFFGEMALLDDQPRTADVRATSGVKCLVLSSWEFWAAVGDEPEVLRTLLKETVRRLRANASALTD